jgi:hypothetical protein
MEMTEKLTPWYRQFWPWFLMLFPAAAVVGGIITIRLATTSYDGVVEDDYYKQGLAINRTLARDQVAASAGLAARVQMKGGEASLQLQGQLAAWPATLRLRILHPTRSGMDQTVLLASRGGGRYAGACQAPASGKWNLVLEDELRNWRLAGHLQAGSAEAALTPVQ